MLRLRDHPEALIVLVSIWLMLGCDSAYWHVISGADPTGTASLWQYRLAAGAVTFGLTSLLLLLLAVGPLTRWVLATLLILSAAVAFFSQTYGMLFDEHMLANVIETNVAEAGELLSPQLLLNLFLYGLLPALLVVCYPLATRSLRAAFACRALAVCAAIGIIGVGMFAQGKELISLARNHREIRYLLTPLNILSATYAYSHDALATTPEFTHIALDAVKAAPASGARRPLVQLLIVGETARADNFSLGGYTRATNPKLAARPIIYFSQASSCGTATAISLPCMFSLQTRTEFDVASSRYQDNLLDIAARAGYKVIWLDNGNSCKNVCARVETRNLHSAQVADLCRENDCYDEILVRELESVLAETREDTLIVLHQIGSHGPAYYLRHPPDFSKFLPECTTPGFDDCSQTEIINAYDNTILYTDHVIDRVIGTLEAHAGQLDTSLLYVSDHGESLGEYGLYLHAVPYRLAPRAQTHVPMLAWFSPEFQEREGLGGACSRKLRDTPVSHDYVFHTILALLDIRSAVYQPELDLFAACHSSKLIAEERSRLDPGGPASQSLGAAL